MVPAAGLADQHDVPAQGAVTLRDDGCALLPGHPLVGIPKDVQDGHPGVGQGLEVVHWVAGGDGLGLDYDGGAAIRREAMAGEAVVSSPALGQDLRRGGGGEGWEGETTSLRDRCRGSRRSTAVAATSVMPDTGPPVTQETLNACP